MQQASFLVFPSEWYEGLPRTIIESLAVGTPIVASNLGAMHSLVTHGATGMHFQPRDPEDLKTKAEWMFTHPDQVSKMRQSARIEFETKYMAKQNYYRLMEIYSLVIKQAKSKIPIHISA